MIGARFGSCGLCSIEPRLRYPTGARWVHMPSERLLRMVRVNFLARYPGMVLGEHAVDVHMELAGAGAVIAGQGEAHINTGAHELADDGIVSLVRLARSQQRKITPLKHPRLSHCH